MKRTLVICVLYFELIGASLFGGGIDISELQGIDFKQGLLLGGQGPTAGGGGGSPGIILNGISVEDLTALLQAALSNTAGTGAQALPAPPPPPPPPPPTTPAPPPPPPPAPPVATQLPSVITKNIITTLHQRIPVPYPQIVQVPIRIPVTIPKPYPVTVTKTIPVPVPKPIPYPVYK